MSAIPSNYSVPPVVSNMTAVDNEENRSYLAKIEKLGSIILSEDPNVTVEQKILAIRALSSERVNSSGQSWRAAGAQEAISKAYWLATASPFAREADAAGSRFNHEMISAGRAAQSRNDAPSDAGRANLNALNRRSADEQKLIAYNMGFSSLEEFRSSLEQRSRDFSDQNPAPAVKVTLSEEAKASLVKSDRDDALETDAKSTSTTITAESGASINDIVALTVMQNAAEDRQERAEKRKADEKDDTGLALSTSELIKAQRDYVAGNAVDRAV